jgi:hypothetical protein
MAAWGTTRCKGVGHTRRHRQNHAGCQRIRIGKINAFLRQHLGHVTPGNTPGASSRALPAAARSRRWRRPGHAPAAAAARSKAERSKARSGQAMQDGSGPALRLFCEARLDKMLIERKGPSDAQLLHDEKGDAICERVILVLMALEICPPFVK